MNNPPRDVAIAGPRDTQAFHLRLLRIGLAGSLAQPAIRWHDVVSGRVEERDDSHTHGNALTPPGTFSSSPRNHILPDFAQVRFDRLELNDEPTQHPSDHI